MRKKSRFSNRDPREGRRWGRTSEYQTPLLVLPWENKGGEAGRPTWNEGMRTSKLPLHYKIASYEVDTLTKRMNMLLNMRRKVPSRAGSFNFDPFPIKLPTPKRLFHLSARFKKAIVVVVVRHHPRISYQKSFQ